MEPEDARGEDGAGGAIVGGGARKTGTGAGDGARGRDALWRSDGRGRSGARSWTWTLRGSTSVGGSGTAFNSSQPNRPWKTSDPVPTANPRFLRSVLVERMAVSVVSLGDVADRGAPLTRRDEDQAKL